MAYRYLRLSVSGASGGGSSGTGFNELEYYVGATKHPTQAMTGASAPSPLVASASAARSGFEAWRAFDEAAGAWFTALGTTTAWIQIDLGAGNGIQPSSLRLNASQSQWWPSNFVLDGSNTGAFAGEEDELFAGAISYPGDGQWATQALVVPVELTADPLTMGAVDLGSPALGQVHFLTADDLATGAPTLGSPELTEFTPPTELTADPLTMGAITLDSPVLGQVHYLTADPLTMGPISLGEPQLVFMADIGVLSLSVLPAAAAYDIGDVMDLQAAFTAIGGGAIDPDSVRFLMRDPAGELTTYVYGEDVQVQRLDTGLYSVRWTVVLAGSHWWRYEGVGAGQAAEEKQTLVNVSRVLG